MRTIMCLLLAAVLTACQPHTTPVPVTQGGTPTDTASATTQQHDSIPISAAADSAPDGGTGRHAGGIVLMSSVAPITGIVLLDAFACEDVPLFGQWIDSLPGKKFLVILKCCQNKAAPTIAALRARPNVTIYFDESGMACQAITAAAAMIGQQAPNNAPPPPPPPPSPAPAGVKKKTTANDLKYEKAAITLPAQLKSKTTAKDAQQKTKQTTTSFNAALNMAHTMMHTPFQTAIFAGTQVSLPDNEHIYIAGFPTDLIAGTLRTEGTVVRHTVYVQDLDSTPELTADLKAICSADSIVYLGGRHVLEGGNHFMIANHLFVGNSFIHNLPLTNKPMADSILYALYGLDTTSGMTIDYVDVPDQHNLLYHLDLIFTCTGADDHGMYQFFTGRVPDDQIAAGGAEVDTIAHHLDLFTRQLTPLLDRYFKGHYTITRVPVYVDRTLQFVMSPLNGVMDYADNAPVFYFPMLDLSDPDLTKSGLTPDDFRRMNAVQQDALGIFQKGLGHDHVIPLPVPGKLIIYLGSQSLHCTMATVGRQY